MKYLRKIIPLIVAIALLTVTVPTADAGHRTRSVARSYRNGHVVTRGYAAGPGYKSVSRCAGGRCR